MIISWFFSSAIDGYQWLLVLILLVAILLMFIGDYSIIAYW